MADELTLSLKFTFEKNGYKDSRSISDSVTVTGNATCGGVQTIGTTHEAIGKGDIGTCGFMRVMNIDSTNYVELGVEVAATFYPFVKLKPGESSVFRLGTSTPYAKANTASVRIDYLIVED